MNKQIITGTMLQGSFFSVNKVVAKYLKSNDAALLLSHLIYLQEHHFKGEEFYQQQERLMEECNISLAVLRKCMNLLSEENILFIVKKKKSNDTTPRNYYTIDYNRIAEVMNLFGSQETVPPVLMNHAHRSSGIKISGPHELCSQIIDDNKVNKKEVNKKEVDNKDSRLDINIRDILIKDKIYTPGNKIPQSFSGVNEYLSHLHTLNY